MPGQTLNVLDVPCDTERFVSRSRSSSISISTATQTLNPDDRFLTPRPAPKPKLPKLITSAEGMPTAFIALRSKVRLHLTLFMRNLGLANVLQPLRPRDIYLLHQNEVDQGRPTLEVQVLEVKGQDLGLAKSSLPQRLRPMRPTSPRALSSTSKTLRRHSLRMSVTS